MKKSFKKFVALAATVTVTAGLAIGGTMAYYQDTASDVNVMTLGNVSIDQLEYERVVENGAWVSTGETDKYGYIPDELQKYTQSKPLYPAVFADGTIKWDDRNGSTAEDGTGHQQSWGQIGASGSNQLFDDSVKNAQDKFVFVENTGKSDAYVRTLIAYEQGGIAAEDYNNVILTNANRDHWSWKTIATDVEIEGNKYVVVCATYLGPKSNPTGILAPGNISYPSLLQVYMSPEATNEDAEAIDGNGNGAYDILVLSQAVQTEGFADAETALDTAFGKVTSDTAAEWFVGIRDLETVSVTPENIANIDFTEENQRFSLSGDFEALAISELGAGSVIAFDEATVGEVTLGDNTTIEGIATVEKITLKKNSTEPIELTLSDAKLQVLGEINVSNTDGKSILNIDNSNIKATTIFVGGHNMNAPAAMAEFNVTDSFLSCEENGLGSTIAIWGQSGVTSKIYDSEIHTYSRGWHQSEDANDNAITFQGAGEINVDVQRTNMHLYGARSIVNARQYGSAETNVNFTIDESLIWVVTKSSHGENTLPVWNATEITDSALIFTKNVYQSTPVLVNSFIYGNPVIHGDYAITTQCGWDTDIALNDGQTVTIAKDANVSVYDGAAKVNFVLSGSAKVVVEAGATLTNIDVKAADGHTLKTTTANGVTTYTAE